MDEPKDSETVDDVANHNAMAAFPGHADAVRLRADLKVIAEIAMALEDSTRELVAWICCSKLVAGKVLA